MNDVTKILSQIDAGDPAAADKLLPMVYAELRALAAQKLAREPPGQTLQATGLVHEAYIRIVGDGVQGWNSRGHFFGAAAEAMRRILVEKARRQKSAKHGGDLARQDIEAAEVVAPGIPDDLIALDDALDELSREDSACAELVKLRYFTGLTNKQTAEILDISPRKAGYMWAFARSWLRRRIAKD